MTDTLAVQMLAQVPEVQAAIEGLASTIRVIPNDNGPGVQMRWSGPSVGALIEKVRDAVLSAERERMTRVVGGDLLDLTPYEQALLNGARDAERQRLLGMTPEEVVEAAVAQWVEMGDTDLCEEAEESGHGSAFSCPACARLTIRNLLPLLLAPEIAKREAVERELEAVRSGSLHYLRDELAHAEAEVARLREALGAFVAQCDAMDKRTPGSGYFFPREAVAPLRAALSGRDTV